MDIGILVYVFMIYLFYFNKLMKIINLYVMEEMVVCFIIYSVWKVVIRESRFDKLIVWICLEKVWLIEIVGLKISKCLDGSVIVLSVCGG